ncbi:MAG: glutamine synthetase [Thermomicrobiales bacterium]|nr:glutamine synthetase [Thermomicrobiales bacterium]
MVITAQAATTGDVVERVERERVQLVDLVFSDISGGAKALTIPAELLAATLDHGYRFDGSALTGGVRKVELDLYLVPDPTTLLVYPPEPDGGRRARLSCTVRRRDGHAFDGDPRSVLERSLAAARELGFDYRVGIEMEFYLVRGDWSNPTPSGDAAGYFDVGEDAAAGTRDEVLMTLQTLGVGAGGAHHETGPGQEEIDLLPADALQMADRLITVRQVIRSVAQRRGLRATFMPKPFADAPGSGVHVFQRLRRRLDGGDALRNEGDGLSTTAYRMIAGQLAHAGGMCAVTCPTVNSYKRLNAGHRAPRHATWAHLSEASLIRVPSWASGEESAIELRCPDSMANPYLAFAVALSTALDGIRNGDEPPEPLDEGFSSYDDAGLQRIGVPRLPGTLGEALIALTQDQVVQEILGDYIYDQLLSVKRAEWEDYRAHVGPWELRRYGDA